MINKAILTSEIQQYINANLQSDLHSLLLKKSPFSEVSIQEIVQQIKGKKVAESKFPILLKNDIVFPPQLNLEQASSESTGNYKSSWIFGNSLLDLTSGFGIDALFLSKNFENITLVEQNEELINIVQHNWKILGKKASFFNQRLETFLENNQSKFDVVYLDPARRDEKKNKIFLLEDLSPNVIEIQDQLLKITEKIIIKLSPLIDISYVISVLKNVEEIHIVAVKNDVKEILAVQSKQKINDSILIKTINLETEEPSFEIQFGEEKLAKSEFSEPLEYLYIPNNAVLKSGAFNSIAEKFALKKLHSNTHFYTSHQKIQFPGRVLKVEKISAKQIQKNEQYNIISKNYPLKPEEIKKKYQLKDGGNQYLIFTQSVDGKIILKSS